MKTVLLIVAITVGFAARAHAETYDLRDFERVSVSAGIELVIVEGRGFEVTGEALEGDIDRLIVERRGNRLVIDRRPNRSLLGFGSQDRFRVEVMMPALERLDASSGSTVDLTPEGTEAIRFDVSSGAQVEVAPFAGDVEAHVSSGAGLDIATSAAGEVELNVSSGASVTIEGPCRDLDIRVSSGGRVEAGDLTCERAEIDASSSGAASAYASEEARLNASSGGYIEIGGDADDLRQNTSSGGSVRVN